MERLESKLFDAAKTGSVSLLQELLNEDPLILDRVEVNYFSETPLHVAAILGHTDFVKEIISIKPELTYELNLHQSSPLHLASAKGHTDVVSAILAVDSCTCMVRDKNGLTPLHLAAIKGRVKVMKMLLRAKPDAAQVMVHGSESIYHLCVKHCQLEVLKLLVNTVGNPEFVSSKDKEGNTVLHLAVADKQVETINFLLTVAALEVNALNLNGMTAMDVLIKSRRDVRDSEIEESLKHAGAFVTLETNIPPYINQNMENKSSINQEEWFDRQRSALMVVASLIATMAFQVAVSPPGGVWQDDKLFDEQGNPLNSTDFPQRAHVAGFSIMAQNSPREFRVLLLYNTMSFIASLSIILLLMSGLPIKRRFFMWILIVFTWVAIITNGITYFDSVLYVIPYKEAIQWYWGAFILWIGLMVLLVVFGHMTRLILKLVKKLRRRYQGGG